MTLLDFGKLLRHHLKLVIVMPVACAIVAALVSFLTPATFRATATLVTDADLTVMSGFAQNESVDFSQNGITVTSGGNVANQSIVITAEGNDYGGCIAAANATVLALSDDVRSASSDSVVDVSEASYAVNVSQSPEKIIIIAFLIGLLIAICLIVILDAIKTPVRSRRDIKESSGLPIIGEIPARDRGERLLANIRFVAECTPSTIAVVPISGSGAAITCAELTNALVHSGVKTTKAKAGAHTQNLRSEQPTGVTTVIECPPLSEGMGAAYIARDVDLTILCATEWLDSRRVLANVSNELKMANAKLGGVVFLVDGKPAKDF